MSSTSKTKAFRTWFGNFLKPNTMKANKYGPFEYSSRLGKISRSGWRRRAVRGRPFSGASGGRRSTHRKKRNMKTRNRKTKYRK